MEIDIKKYITDEQISDIVADAVRDKVNYAMSESLSNMISNAAYKIVWEMVNKEFDNKLENMLKDKVVKLINNLGIYNVFHWASYAYDKNSRGAEIVDETVSGMRNEIAEKVRKEFEGFKFTEKVKNELVEMMMTNFRNSKSNPNF